MKARTEKHRRFHLFHRCGCVSCTVAFFAKAQAAMLKLYSRAA